MSFSNLDLIEEIQKLPPSSININVNNNNNNNNDNKTSVVSDFKACLTLKDKGALRHYAAPTQITDEKGTKFQYYHFDNELIINDLGFYAVNEKGRKLFLLLAKPQEIEQILSGKQKTLRDGSLLKVLRMPTSVDQGVAIHTSVDREIVVYYSLPYCTSTQSHVSMLDIRAIAKKAKIYNVRL